MRTSPVNLNSRNSSSLPLSSSLRRTRKPVSGGNRLLNICKKTKHNIFLSTVAKELKEAFRLYDKEGNGFIPTSCLKEIMRELDDKLSDEELDGMIAEIDSDGSGTVDFDGEFDMQSGSWIKLNLIFSVSSFYHY